MTNAPNEGYSINCVDIKDRHSHLKYPEKFACVWIELNPPSRPASATVCLNQTLIAYSGPWSGLCVVCKQMDVELKLLRYRQVGPLYKQQCWVNEYSTT